MVEQLIVCIKAPTAFQLHCVQLISLETATNLQEELNFVLGKQRTNEWEFRDDSWTITIGCEIKVNVDLHLLAYELTNLL